MLPFSDIDFFVFGALYVLLIWLFGVIFRKKNYPVITFVLTLFYLVFYFKYSITILAYGLFSYIFIRFFSTRINHRLVSAIIIACPMLLVKVHLDPSFIYFAGLSFVTFRSIQVCIDRTKEEGLNFIHYFNFLFFIPSLYIGPLDRYKRFTENSRNAYALINEEFILKGIQEITKGILYKFVIAELVARYWLSGPNEEPLSSFREISDIYAYALFLFFDFAGYSAMAVGMANLVGIDLPFNFNKPFLARNPADFWQRWHASLTHWLTDYFFKPFYKWLNQIKKLKKYPIIRQNTAIFFTFFLMGAWNGFEPNFIWSGIIYGLYSVIYNTYLIECRKKDKDIVFGNLSPVFIKYLSIFIMFNLTCFALYIFSGRCL
jgi:membrane protein involved in D-alanine export